MTTFKLLVTEREILHGILQVEKPEKSCLWFKRNIQGIENIADSKILTKFIGSYFSNFASYWFLPFPNANAWSTVLSVSYTCSWNHFTSTSVSIGK